MRNRGEKKSYYGNVTFKRDLPLNKLKYLSNYFQSYKDIFTEAQVNIQGSSKLFSTEVWQDLKYLQSGDYFFNLAVEIIIKKLSILRMERPSILSQIVGVRWSRLIQLRIQNCEINNIECLSLMDAKFILSLSLQSNHIINLRGLRKCISLKNVKKLDIGNKTLNKEAFDVLSEVDLYNLKEIKTLVQTYHSKYQLFDKNMNFLAKTHMASKHVPAYQLIHSSSQLYVFDQTILRPSYQTFHLHYIFEEGIPSQTEKYYDQFCGKCKHSQQEVFTSDQIRLIKNFKFRGHQFICSSNPTKNQ